MRLISFNMKLLIPGYIRESFEHSHQNFLNVFDIFFVDHFNQRIVLAVKIKTNVPICSRRRYHSHIDDSFFIYVGKINIICSLIEQWLNIISLVTFVIDQNRNIVILFTWRYCTESLFALYIECQPQRWFWLSEGKSEGSGWDDEENEYEEQCVIMCGHIVWLCTIGYRFKCSINLTFECLLNIRKFFH